MVAGMGFKVGFGDPLVVFEGAPGFCKKEINLFLLYTLLYTFL